MYACTLDPVSRDAQATKKRILAVARSAFARHGFDGTTIRSIAAAAGVAPNLITRYFGGKAGLFKAATSMELGVPAVLPGPRSSLGSRIAANVVKRWEAADSTDALLMMLRSAGTSDVAAAELGNFFLEQAAEPLSEYLHQHLGYSRAEADDRVAAAGSLILGVVMIRYVMRTGPLAAAEPSALTRWLGDRLQRLLQGPPPPPLR